MQEKEIKELELAVSAFFDYVESLISRRNTFNMEQFSDSVNKFLPFMGYQILPDNGRKSASQAKAKVEQEYDIFNRTQLIDSNYDKQIRGMLEQGE